MIFIIRALSQWGKDDEDYDSPTSRDEASDFKKKKKRKKEKEKEKMKKYMREAAIATTPSVYVSKSS